MRAETGSGLRRRCWTAIEPGPAEREPPGRFPVSGWIALRPPTDPPLTAFWRGDGSVIVDFGDSSLPGSRPAMPGNTAGQPVGAVNKKLGYAGGAARADEGPAGSGGIWKWGVFGWSVVMCRSFPPPRKAAWERRLRRAAWRPGGAAEPRVGRLSGRRGGGRSPRRNVVSSRGRRVRRRPSGAGCWRKRPGAPRRASRLRR